MFLVKSLLFIALLLSAILSNSQKTNAPIKPASQISSETDALLLESGKPTKLRQIGLTNGEIKIVSYNIRYRSGDDLTKLLKLFREDPEIGNAMISDFRKLTVIRNEPTRQTPRRSSRKAWDLTTPGRLRQQRSPLMKKKQASQS